MTDVNAELARLDAMRSQGQIAEPDYQARRAALFGGGAYYGGQPYPGQPFQGQPYPGQPPFGAPPPYPGQQPGYGQPYGQQPYGQPYPPRQGGSAWPSIAGLPPQTVKLIAIALAVLIAVAGVYFAVRKPDKTVAGAGTTQPAAGGNPLIGSWTGTGQCTGLRLEFGPTSVTAYERSRPETRQSSYEVIDQSTVRVRVQGESEDKAVTFTIANGTMSFTDHGTTCTMQRG